MKNNLFNYKFLCKLHHCLIESVSTPSLIDGSGLAPDEKEIEMKKIHEENLAKLSSMSKEEILHHQEQIKKYLSKF